MTVTDYASFRQYFSNLAFSNPDLAIQGDGRAFVWFDEDIKMHYERSEARYPVMEVEHPSIVASMIRGGNHYQTWSCAFSILNQANPDDFEAQESALEFCEKIMTSILSRINKDRIFEGTDFRISPVRNVINDSLWGWAVEWTMDVPADYCWKEEEWKGIHRIKPVWTVSETILSLTVNGTEYQSSWTDQASITSALSSLSQAIPEESYVDEDTIVILASTGQTNLITTGSGHAWQFVTIWPL